MLEWCAISSDLFLHGLEVDVSELREGKRERKFLVAVQFSQHHLLKKLASLYIHASFVMYWVTIGTWVYFWMFCPLTLIYISVFVPVPYCFDDCSLTFDDL